MHFQMKIQPIDNRSYDESVNSDSPVAVKPVLKSRLKRLFDRQFPSVLKNNSEKVNEVKDGEFEPSSVCLAKMVQNFIEDAAAPEKPKCGRNRCNCFNGNINDVSDDEFDLSAAGYFGDSVETLKSLIPCASVIQRNLLADTSKIVEKNKTCKRKDELTKLVAEELLSFGYESSICKSHWEKTSSYPAGEYKYLDVIFETGERVLIDIDFRSEFEIARPTGNYKAILQSLPYIFVGEADRLQQILSIVTEAAKLSLKKKGMHVPPWRKFEYMRSKWLSPHTRAPPPPPSLLPPTPPPTPDANAASKQIFAGTEDKSVPASECGDFEMIFGEEAASFESKRKSDDGLESPAGGIWEPPAIKPRNVERGSKLVVTGLASLFS
ncbi:hypothetical protein HanRHA438_Chr03g0148551 [Helianthus annuus]|uniref:DUF506 family protein n=2 Tax=Helianthus annuus TaxID=4232 RepID=A0A9K3JKB4_HELAN|nr:uncharacterized protein LOC110930992 isoform X1 [Helianthus annuus]KAF5816684.1 hypothetical protein HanXRQr2_Chr03g0136981 [Helianthus annuus]KAJ0594913.1 hypothetical protein HanHA300_Chr03g0113591 [Helianthus annuus]KAJ0603248.1 hypothetical protein HanIR_Chr03g0148441 [Helianthus annuus]KAJ0609957.1 hypothetical protein HanHA89_Chr03g0125531 [Helianthus annuus]KAJ0775742.1 hypothetical protein HanOQP8_Chr03g0126091 [Helianthus annuus]